MDILEALAKLVLIYLLVSFVAAWIGSTLEKRAGRSATTSGTQPNRIPNPAQDPKLQAVLNEQARQTDELHALAEYFPNMMREAEKKIAKEKHPDGKRIKIEVYYDDMIQRAVAHNLTSAVGDVLNDWRDKQLQGI